VHDDALRFAPRCQQAIEILVMVKRIAATPVDETDVGIYARLAVEIVACPGIEQHVGDARNRDRRFHCVVALRQHGAEYPVASAPSAFTEP